MASIISAGTTSNTALNLSADTTGVLQLASNGSTTAITVDTSQNVGIGTASPTQKLEVNGRVLSSSLSVASSVYIWSQNRMSLGASVGIESQQSSPLFMLTQGVAQPIVFGTNSTEAMRIDSSGNVGIGTSSPSSFNAFANQLVVGNGSSSQGITIYAVNAGSLSFADGTAGTAPYQGYITYNHVSDYMAFYANYSGSSSPRLLINSNGTTILQGGNLAANGTGITFPATQSASSDANTLDDYEEGTWTPTLTASTSNPTVGYAAQSGFYTKIGRVVSIQGRMQLNSISGGSGNFRLSGLPFSNSGGLAGAGTSWFSFLDLSAGYTMASLYIETGNNFCSLAQSGDNNSANQMTIAAVGSQFDICFAFTYITST